jgi:hypothetical protein
MRRFIGVSVIAVLAVPFAWGSGSELPPGPAKAKIEASCKQCHDLKVITKQHQDKKWWAKTLDKMVEHGLEIDPADQQLVLKYLSTNFGVKGAGGSTKKVAKN